MRIGTLSALIVLTLAVPALAAAPPTAGKTGVYEAAFSARSPLSDPKELAARLGQKTLDGDYDPAKEDCIVCVPESYTPDKPIGLVVLLNYKASGEPPTPVMSVFDELNLGLVIPKNNGQPWWAKCALALDAVHGMQQAYKIDPRRVYVFGFDLEHAAFRLATSFPDVFTGAAVYSLTGYWKPINTPRKTQLKAVVPTPPTLQAGVAKSHPLALLVLGEEKEFDTLVFKALKSDGFKSVKQVKVSQEDVHYPNYTKPWLVETLKFLDDNAPKPKEPASRPAKGQQAPSGTGGAKVKPKE